MNIWMSSNRHWWIYNRPFRIEVGFLRGSRVDMRLNTKKGKIEGRRKESNEGTT
jgi:hypothetical protein